MNAIRGIYDGEKFIPLENFSKKKSIELLSLF